MQCIRPLKNTSNAVQANNIANVLPVAAQVNAVLYTSCYNCHSNNTKYPWYAQVMPVGWVLSNHVNEGKKHFNFDEFATYTTKRKIHKLEEVIEQIQLHEMPMNSYTWLHQDAVLDSTKANMITSWAASSIQLLKSKQDTLTSQ